MPASFTSWRTFSRSKAYSGECMTSRMRARSAGASGEARSCFERAHALALEQIGERIDFGRELSQRIVCARAARAKRIVAFAQRRDHVGKRLQGADQALDHGGCDKQQVDHQTHEH